jgi:hypothetical protein
MSNRRRFVRLCLWAGALPVSLAFCVATGPTEAASASTPFSLTTNPELVPSFSPSIHYYVIRCSGDPTTDISTTGTGTVVIGGIAFAEPADVHAPLVADQAVTVSWGGTKKYTVRCLPGDFPAYTATVTGSPQSDGYLVTPSGGPGGTSADYAIAFDRHGVPVWWYQNQSPPVNAAFFGPNEIGWWTTGCSTCSGGTYTIRNLDGAPLTSIGDPEAGTGLDAHDFQKLPNGDYLGILDEPGTTDLSSWGLSSTAPVDDCVIVELNAQSQVVWSWSTIAHIDVATANVNWRNQYPDVIHMNSVQEVGNQIIMSARHLDAVYDIDKTTGQILWKIGGSATPQSLTVVGNQYPAVFSGQHDARKLPNGTITVHDDATQETGVSARALQFRIDEKKRTATIIEDVTDPNFPQTSLCCGSAIKLAGGDWLVDWGFGDSVAELTPQSQPVVEINYAPFFSYRAAPVETSDAVLSKGMDAMVPPLTL